MHSGQIIRNLDHQQFSNGLQKLIQILSMSKKELINFLHQAQAFLQSLVNQINHSLFDFQGFLF